MAGCYRSCRFGMETSSLSSSDGRPESPSGSSAPSSPLPSGSEPAANPLLAPPALLDQIPPFLPPVLPAPVQPPPPPPAPFVFHGRAAEYFRIWIVNTLLTLLTGGIFLAWAKVRKRRYLRGNTELLGHRFDYRANPRGLLVGNIIVLLFFLGYAFLGSLYRPVQLSAIGLGILLLPWIVVRSLSFNAHNTVYRGLRFRFHPSLSGAAKIYLFKPLLIPLSLGIYYPAWVRERRRYTVQGHRLGDAYFHQETSTGQFYATYLLGGLIIAGLVGVASLYLVGMVAWQKTGQLPLAWMIPYFIVYGFGLFLGRQFIFAQMFNHLWNHTRLDEHRFVARMELGKWIGLQLTNLGAILITAGMLYPCGVIRSHRYTASCLGLHVQGTLDTIENMGRSQGNAAGDSAAEFSGVDFGL